MLEKEFLFNMPLNKYYTFKCVQGIWRDVTGDSGNVLADTLAQLNVIIDDDAQFCRIIRYTEEYIETITYRAYSNAKITITISYREYD